MEQRQPPFDGKIGKTAKITRVNSVFYLLPGSFLLEFFYKLAFISLPFSGILTLEIARL
jgi:hypothetical protein